jgi:hypothetical protein
MLISCDEGGQRSRAKGGNPPHFPSQAEGQTQLVAQHAGLALGRLRRDRAVAVVAQASLEDILGVAAGLVERSQRRRDPFGRRDGDRQTRAGAVGEREVLEVGVFGDVVFLVVPRSSVEVAR